MKNTEQSNFDKYLFALYSASCAPLSDQTSFHNVVPQNHSNRNIHTAYQEFQYIQKLCNVGFASFIHAFKSLDKDIFENYAIPPDTPEITTTLIAGAAFAKRISLLASNLCALCTATAEKTSSDPTDVAQELEYRMKQGERPENPVLNNCLDLSLEASSDWNILEVFFRNRVGFKQTAAVITDGKVEEEALKEFDDYVKTEVRRRKQRNPTGYHKFNFKDLRLDDSDVESECKISGRGTSTDGGSTRGSISGFHSHGGILTSRSVSSGTEDRDTDDFDKLHNPFTLRQRTSTVGFSSENEREIIKDKEADPSWEEEKRHQKRFFRIRNRVPTGHPSVMRAASDELAEIVDQFTKKLSDVGLDPTAVENANVNRNIPPLV